MNGYPDGNPKTAAGALKVPLHLVPPSASHYLALAFKDGAAKYGPYNWRDSKVSASVYFSAARRHLDAWFDGEDVSPDALVHHLGHVMACCAIILDAASIAMLNDDRPTRGAAGRLQARYANPITPAQALDMVSMDSPIELAEGVLAHVVEAPMPAAIEELIARSENDEEPGHLKAGEAYTTVGDPLFVPLAVLVGREA